jgi:ribonuclease BN (tRNA processing enzyme)
MRIIPLGVGGFVPASGHETASVLLIDDDTLILLDAGTGARRLAEDAVVQVLPHRTDLHVVFSHVHHDHTAGLTWLLKLWPGRLHLYVPTAPLVNFDGVAALKELTNPPFFSLPLEDWPNLEHVEGFDAPLRIADRPIGILKQQHSGGSVGVRVGNFAYISDTEPRGSTVPFISECAMVFMDTMYDSADFADLDVTDDTPAEHGYSVGNARVGSDARVDRLGLIHIDPLYDARRQRLLVAEARQEFGGAFIPEEGVVYEIP